MSDVSTRLVQEGCWQWVRGTGLERFELRRGDEGWLLQGTIVALTPGGPAEARYRVVCDDGWQTRAAEVSLRDGRGEHRIQLAAGEGRWEVNGREQPGLRGCIDVDLEWSPSTNTLPIRRLRLAPMGSSVVVEAAWVRFRALTVERLSQAYACLARDRVRYSSGNGSFTAELELDQEGLVVDYAGIWRRVTET